MELVLIGRNEKCDIFQYKEKSIFEKEVAGVKVMTTFSIVNEKNLIDFINDPEYKFFTYDKINMKYTNITTHNENIKSVANSTKLDNIKNLPIIL